MGRSFGYTNLWLYHITLSFIITTFICRGVELGGQFFHLLDKSAKRNSRQEANTQSRTELKFPRVSFFVLDKISSVGKECHSWGLMHLILLQSKGPHRSEPHDPQGY